MKDPFERYATNLLELAFLRKGFKVYQEQAQKYKNSRLDFLVTDPNNLETFGIELKNYDRHSSFPIRSIKPKKINFREQSIFVHTVFVSSEPKCIYIDSELSKFIETTDSHIKVLRGAV